MNKERTPPKKFHLNRYQYKGIDHWTPPPTRDKSLAYERRKHPNTLVYEQQSRALQAMARFATHTFDSPSDQHNANLIIARPLIGAASYQLAGSTMYSILDLANVAEGTPKRKDAWYQTDEGLHEMFLQQLGRATQMSNLYLESTRTHDHDMAHTRGRIVGKLMGNASLNAIMLDMPSKARQSDPFDVQTTVRERTMDFVEEVGEYAHATGGILPSIAQIVEPDSEYSVHIRRTAATPVLRAFEQSVQAFPEQITT